MSTEASTAPEDDSAAFVRALERDELLTEVDNSCKLFLNTRDGRFLWRAFVLLHDAGEDIPKNLLDKFAQWGRRLEGAETPRDIAAALELAGDAKKHRGIKHSAAYETSWDVASEVRREAEVILRKGPDEGKPRGLSKAIALVAKRRRRTPAAIKAEYYKVFAAVSEAPKTGNALDTAMRGWRSK